MDYSTITASDVYECCYYYLNNSEIEAIECEKVNGKLVCKVTFSGPNLAALQYNYYSNDCQVNLYNFRRAFQQITSYLNEAKKMYKRQTRSAPNEGGGLC